MPELLKDTYGWVQNNKLQFGMASFFLGAMIQTNLMQSGAFEIYINDKLMFSKLESGRMPNINDIHHIFSQFGVKL